jgi:ABC-type sugar transport system substrate-binding protein
MMIRQWAIGATAVMLAWMPLEPAQAQDEKGNIGVSMPTIQGPWYTPLLYGVT